MFVMLTQPSLEDLLVQTKLISASQLAQAQRDASSRSTRLSLALIDLKFVTDRKFAEWLSAATKIPMVDPLRADVIEDIQSHVPADVAHAHLIVPIDVNADEMTIATINPLDRESIDAIHEATGLKIHAVIGIRGQLEEMVERIYPTRRPFDASATVAVEMEPFAFGDETILRMHSRQFTFDSADENFGSETRVASRAPELEPIPAGETTNPTAEQIAASAVPESQLDRIEHHLVDLLRAVDSLQRRVDAIDAVLARTVNRN